MSLTAMPKVVTLADDGHGDERQQEGILHGGSAGLIAENLIIRSMMVSSPQGVSRLVSRGFGLTPGSVAMIRLKLSPAPWVSRS